MDLQILGNLRTAVRGAIKASYSETPVYTAEITSIVEDDGTNLPEFFTVFFAEGEESQERVAIDSDDYNTDTQIVVGYFNKKGETDQSFLESEAGTVREAVMNLNNLAAYKDKITRAGWQHIPPIDGAVAGIYFRFDFSFKN